MERATEKKGKGTDNGGNGKGKGSSMMMLLNGMPVNQYVANLLNEFPMDHTQSGEDFVVAAA